MNTEFYAQADQTARAMIHEFGAPALLSRTVYAQNPAKPWEAPTATVTQIDIEAAILPLKASDLRAIAAAGGSVKIGDARALVAGSFGQITTDDTIMAADGAVWQVVAVIEVAPAGQNVLSKVQVRR